MAGKRHGKRRKHLCLLDDLIGARGKLAGILVLVLRRVHEDKTAQAHVHHTSGRGADVSRRLCVHQDNADVVE